MKSKAEQIVRHLNKFESTRPFDYKNVAEAKAHEIGAGLYWKGTAEPEPALPTAEVWKINTHGKWSIKLGLIVRGVDNVWRT